MAPWTANDMIGADSANMAARIANHAVGWKGSDAIRVEQFNRLSVIGLIVLSLTALMTVLLGLALPAVLSGHIPPPESDEGTGAHVFQLSIVALVPIGLVFLATADWTQPLRSARRLAFPAAAVVLAFGILYVFEHYR